jgi:HK97 family phage major capsid protein
MTTETASAPLPSATVKPLRSRIDGLLHRHMPATLTVREIADRAVADQRLYLTLSVSSETPYLRNDWWEDPWVEVLGHKPDEVDLSRLNGGAPILANHDRFTATGDTPLAGIGAADRAWLDGGRVYADITVSARAALADLRQDIVDGLVRNVSVAYVIEERVLTKSGEGRQPDEYRVTRWTPHEISLVDIPADASVGIGRAADGAMPAKADHYRIIAIDTPPAEGVTTRSHTMDQATAPAPETAVTRSTSKQPDGIELERARVREITAVGRQWNVPDLAEKAIDSGMDADVFATKVLAHLKDTGTLRTAESPEIGLSTKEAESFSFCRAILAASDPHHAATLAPFEMECSRAAQDKRGDSRDKIRESAITIPADVLLRGIQLNAAAARSAQSLLLQRAKHGVANRGHLIGQRDLTVGSATAGGNTVATEVLGSDFITLLRNAMVLERLGCTFLTGLNGNIAIPSHTAATTGYWVAENAAPTESAPTVGQVTGSPKTVGAFVDYSRRLLIQSSIDVEAFVRADLAAVIGLMIQLGAINGAGASNEPTGLLNTSGIGSVAGGTNGLAPTYGNIVDLESAVANANGDVGNLAFLTNTKVRGKLRQTQVFSGTDGKAVWTSQPGSQGVGDVLGYDAVCSNSVPSNLVKGSSGSVCSAIMFGNWIDLIIFMWGGLDIMLDPYTGSSAGTKRVVALQDVDVGVRHTGSFAAMKDALTT